MSSDTMEQSSILSMSTVRRLLKARRAEVASVSIITTTMTIFDNQDVSAPFTRYQFKLRSATADSAPPSKEGWKLRKRFSDFYALHRTLRRSKSQWEKSCFKQEACKSVLAILHQTVGLEFPRKHFRCDTRAIIRKRQQQLTEYLRTLLLVYVELDVVFGTPMIVQGTCRNDFVYLHRTLVDVERFLEVLPVRKALETRLTQRVMALKDVALGPIRESMAIQCCICLGDIHCGGEGGNMMTQLPCLHLFHEDCILHWLQCGSTCPMCRQTVGNAAN